MPKPDDRRMLFLQQSYLDAYETFRAAREGRAPFWDYVVLTASDERQASGYRAQIRRRQKAGFLPRAATYLVVPDPEGRRCGSGGATLAALRAVADSGRSDWENLRVLCIHSGGDSKRIPQYSACGKIFSPVPRMLPEGTPSTLFDEFMIGLAGLPGRIRGGLTVCSGDVLLLFNALQLEPFSDGAAALSIKENVATGKDHGVFLGGADGNVARFLHKQSEETLRASGAVDAAGNVDIDTGAVIFSGGLTRELYALVDTRAKFASLVNERVRLSFYADFLYPLAAESTLERFYRETPEGAFTPELEQARTRVWNALRPFRMKLVRFAPAAFLHFGTTRELLRLMTADMPAYASLGWTGTVNSTTADARYAAYHADIRPGATIGAGSYIENSILADGCVVGKGCVVSGVALPAGVRVPDGTALHVLPLCGGGWVARLYDVTDDPKKPFHRGRALTAPLWDEPLFPVRATQAAAIRASLSGEKKGERLSLAESFRRADASALLRWHDKLEESIRVRRFLAAVDAETPLSLLTDEFPGGLSGRVVRRLIAAADAEKGDTPESLKRRIRIPYYLGRMTGDEALTVQSFDRVREAVLGGTTPPDADLRFRLDEVTERLPVRVNWGGGWSDTPPYCLLNGGTVLNAAITLDGRLPIEATARRLSEHKIILASTDIGSYGEFTDLETLRPNRDPSDAFALHKAALVACGFLRPDAESVEALCRRLGGGLYLNTRVVDIPKGSGLGTSSILAAAAVRALLRLAGREPDDAEICARVLCLEQIMSTGGGWQDQVGGLAPGVKLVSSRPGADQRLTIRPVTISPQTGKELNERFALIYTGQRRLARGILREVMGRYMACDPVSTEVLARIRRLARAMARRLEAGDVDGFAGLMTKHWEQAKRLDEGSTNTCIDQIFLAVEDLTDGRTVCGAGGGGFLQVVLKKGVAVAELEARLFDVFGHSGVVVRKAELV
ncbi:MAG: bifunctional fucokinase/L-fucose-1-P-guanylyltransferase [Eubacteriales bacterium]|nr:bifunctional fucokinase/L-fucose-1-P-guanylyltransferase [Eubacteriales bacterium]